MKKDTAGALLIFALIFITPFAYWIWEWHHLRTSGSYWPTLSFAMPFIAVTMLGLIVANALLPGKMSDANVNRGKYGQLAYISVVVLGLLAGTVNYFLMDHAFNAQQQAPVYTPPGQ